MASLPFVRATVPSRATPATFRRTHREGARRLLNLVVAIAGILLTLPLMLVIAALVKLTSRGPVIYSQSRVGLDRRALTRLGGNTRRHFDYGGRLFTIYKFRTMHVERTDGQNETWASFDDARVTPLGRLLRRLRLDELPQLFNVLRGEMSLVGPRPPLPEEVVRYDGWQRRRLSMKPGLTCLWQVSGRSALCFKRWVELDLRYIDNWSPWLDLKIMLRTVPAVASLKGAW